jgi:hypothetical protein
MSNLYRGPSIDAPYQGSVHLAERFQRRRLKCEKLTDDRWQTPSDGKSSHCLWQGELKIMNVYIRFVSKFELVSMLIVARVAQWVRSLDQTAHTSLSPIWRGFAPSFVNDKKGCTRLAAASDKVYQLLAQGRWFSPASSITKNGSPWYSWNTAESGIKTQLINQSSMLIYKNIIEILNYKMILISNYTDLKIFSSLKSISTAWKVSYLH